VESQFGGEWITTITGKLSLRRKQELRHTVALLLAVKIISIMCI